MIQLAQSLAEAEPGRLLGLTVPEWAILLPMVLTTIGAVAKAWQKARQATTADAKARVVIDAVEEAAAEHPEGVRLVKRLARDKATKLGIQTGPLGLDAEAKRATIRLKRKQNGAPSE